MRGYASRIGLDPDYAVALFMRAFDGSRASPVLDRATARVPPAPPRRAGPSRRSG